MKKILILALLMCLSIDAFSQNKFSLLASNVVKYIGQVDREQFEKIVGYPVGTEEVPFTEGRDTFIIYEIEDTYGGINLDKRVAIRCLYRDDLLLAIRFGTLQYEGYYSDFTNLEGYNKERHCEVLNNKFGEIVKILLELRPLGIALEIDGTMSKHGISQAVATYTMTY